MFAQSLLKQAQACWYTYLYVSTMYLTSLRHTVCSHLENLAHQKWRWSTYTLCLFCFNWSNFEYPNPSFSKKNQTRGSSWWTNLMHPFQFSNYQLIWISTQFGLSKPSGAFRRLRCVDRCGSSGRSAPFRADLPARCSWRIRRWHGWFRREVGSGETCVQHLKSKAYRSIFASILSWFWWNRNTPRNFEEDLVVGRNGSVHQVESVFWKWIKLIHGKTFV